MKNIGEDGIEYSGPRELTEIYKVVLETYKARISFIKMFSLLSEGICDTISSCLENQEIDEIEYMQIQFHLQQNKPTAYLHKEFFNEPNFVDKMYWWDSEKKKDSNDSRIRFIEKMIWITKQEK